MASIRQMLKKVQAFKPLDGVKAVIENKKADVVELQKQQLFRGYNANDEIIGEVQGGIWGYQSEDYAFKKYAKNPLPGLGNPDLFDTGDFYRGIVVKITGQKVAIYSTDSKNLTLTSKYPAIFGLGPKARKTFVQSFLIKGFANYRKEKLGI